MGVHSFKAVSTELVPLHITVVGRPLDGGTQEQPKAAEQDVPRRLRAFSLLLRAVERWRERKRQTEEDRKNFLYPLS